MGIGNLLSLKLLCLITHGSLLSLGTPYEHRILTVVGQVCPHLVMRETVTSPGSDTHQDAAPLP